MVVHDSFARKIPHPVLWIALVSYGLANAILYSSLLPLWEGFDEAFHYGYVQELSTRKAFPTLGVSLLSTEIDTSLRLAPVSHIVARSIPEATTFEEYFSLSARERIERHFRLFALNPSLRSQQSQRGNYEAHQAPLAYLLLAVPDWLWSDIPLPARVWRLRVAASKTPGTTR